MNDDLQTKLNAVYSDYAKGLPKRIEEIEILWNKLYKKWNEEEGKELHRKVHGLHGSAAIFGYKEIAEISKQLENIFPDITDNKISSDQIEKFSSLLEELKNKSVETINTISLKEQTTQKKEENKLLYILNLSNQIDNTNLMLANELKEQMAVFGYDLKSFINFAMLENALADKLPLTLFVNINYLDNEDELTLLGVNKKYSDNLPIIFYSDSNEFQLRLKAVKMGGKGFMVKPFQSHDIVHELDRIIAFRNFTYNILIIDDEIEVANFFSIMLTNAGMKTKVITNINEIESSLHTFKPDLILTDFYMPNCNGQELASIIRQQKTYEFIPIIFLSSEENRQKQLHAMSIGGDDFITKQTNPEYLIKSIQNRSYRYKLLKEMTTKDNLTVVLSQTIILNHLQEKLNESKKENKPLTIAIIEVNHFDQINSEYSFSAGDEVLKALGILLRNRTRVSDEVGKFKETKFLAIFPDSELDKVKNMLIEFQKQYKTINYFYNNQIFAASFNAGIAANANINNIDELIKAAEQELIRNPVK